MIAVLAAALLAATAPQGTTAIQESAEALRIQPMDEQQFWAIMDRTAIHEADPDSQIDALRAELEGLSVDEVLAFRNTFEAQLARAYTWDLWAVAYVAHGGASDDGFEYFRRWMVSKGRVVFEHLIAHPDDLSDILAADSEGVLEFEEILYVASDVWGEKSGQDADNMPGEMTSMTMSPEPRGEPFDEDPGKLALRVPKTWARFGNNPLG